MMGKASGLCPPEGRCTKMNQWKKTVPLCLLLLITVLLFTACGEENPYAVNNSENYTVSIRFDANGGSFTTTDTRTITDSYNIADMAVNADGKVEIPLLEPSDKTRKDACTAAKDGYFLVGWYAQRTENADGTYTYAEPWDFASDRVQADPNGVYSSDEPVLTLYAGWAPEFSVEYYDTADGSLIDTYKFSPASGMDIQIPAWDEESGALEMFKFPKRTGYTLEAVSLDQEGLQIVENATITHPGVLDSANATVTGGTLKLYTTWREGEWYRITSAQQFAKNFNPQGCYDILADLDFTDATWPTALMHGNFSGKINGNGHTISNVALLQTDNSRLHTGLLGNLSGGAEIRDVTFDNVTLTVKGGARVAGASFGLLAGTVAADAQLANVNVTNSQLLIDSRCYFAFDDYVIGLVCGTGAAEVDASGITCTATGDNPEKVNITVTDEMVTLEFVTE